MTELEKARNEINRIDSRMAELFEERMAAVKTVAEYKRKNGIRVTDQAREAEVIARNSALVKSETVRPYYVSFLQNNMELSKAYQHRHNRRYLGCRLTSLCQYRRQPYFS